MARKDELKKLFGMDEPAGEGQAAAPQPKSPAPERKTSGAVKAMGVQLGALASRAEEAEQLKAALASGERVVPLDPTLVEPSPYADRLSDGGRGDETFEDLKRSLDASGQQVPILVRPHPDQPERYQAAYGHRRLRALRDLGRPVLAIIRTLDDAELMLAQGKENAERRDLSFIERALFADTLSHAGFSRAEIQAALGLHKAEMTRLFQVAELVPRHIARAIGPAPKAGRPRWMAIGELLKRDANRVKAEDCIASGAFQEADSDRRFVILFDRISKRGPAKAKRHVIRGEGGAIAAFQAGEKPVLTFEKDAGDFARWLADELPGLHFTYLRNRP